MSVIGQGCDWGGCFTLTCYLLLLLFVAFWGGMQFVSAMREQQLLDDDFVSYLNYLIRHERKEVEDSGLDPDRAPSTWLMVRHLFFRLLRSYTCTSIN